MIENTGQRDPIVHLAGSFGPAGFGGYIEEMEAAGQRQLVNSQLLPTKLNHDTEADFLALGFTFGDPDPSDPLFRPATLPEGWTRQGSDHSMWSHLLDGLGRKRVAIFYKAAFYDRRALMCLETPLSYLRNALYHDSEVVLDDEWLSVAVVDRELAAIRDGESRDAAANAEERSGYWTERAAEHRAEAAKAEALRIRLVAAASRAER